jgi:hypothetical protein
MSRVKLGRGCFAEFRGRRLVWNEVEKYQILAADFNVSVRSFIHDDGWDGRLLLSSQCYDQRILIQNKTKR